MEWNANLKNNEYRVDDNYYVDVVHDFNMHSFDCWLHRRSDDRCIYMTTVRDDMSQASIKRMLQPRIPNVVRILEEKATA